ncbi:hypothetical protein MNBD_ALPHA06-2056 [hydrothermal vent metagenome]|uniref:DUF952 domain-containing protein n=1 Tax=hydrothermal vent metagenome TaxID=652676 RepID=A0A3B0RGH3_9ZZZZ
MIQVLPENLYRLCSLAEWEKVVACGFLKANADDIRDGFIHLSLAEQVEQTAMKFYQQTTDLHLLGIKSAAIREIVRLEAGGSGQNYPHAYGPIARHAIVFARPVPKTNGAYQFPWELFA